MYGNEPCIWQDDLSDSRVADHYQFLTRMRIAPAGQALINKGAAPDPEVLKGKR